jgi:hypothetical protein
LLESVGPLEQCWMKVFSVIYLLTQTGFYALWGETGTKSSTNFGFVEPF